MSVAVTPPCRVCGKTKPVLCYPDDHSLAICPDCCEKAEHPNGETGHEIIYSRPEREHYCAHCGQPASDEWRLERAADMAESEARR